MEASALDTDSFALAHTNLRRIDFKMKRRTEQYTEIKNQQKEI